MGRQRREMGDSFLARGEQGLGASLRHCPLGPFPEASSCSSLDSGRCGKVYYELPPSDFPDSSRGCNSYLPFLCHRHN